MLNNFLRKKVEEKKVNMIFNDIKIYMCWV